MVRENVVRRAYIAISAVAGVLAGVGTVHAGLVPTRAGYAVKYQIDGAWVSPIDLVSNSQLVAGSMTYDANFNSLLNVAPVSLNSGPVGQVVYTQPALASGSTYASGFLATAGGGAEICRSGIA